MEEEKSTFGAIMNQLRCEAEVDKVAAKAAQAEAEAAKAASLAALVAHQAVVHTHTERMGVAEQARGRMEGRIHSLQVGGCVLGPARFGVAFGTGVWVEM